MPGLLWILPANFVWGPVGGAQEPPSELRGYYGVHWGFELIRAARKRLTRWNPLVRLALQRAKLVVAANRDTEERLAPIVRCPMERLLEAAVSVPSVDERREGVGDDEGLRILWAGVFEPRKAPLLALDAAERATDRGARMRIIMAGDGPMRPDIEKQVEKRNLNGVVELLGRLSYREMIQTYRSADIFLFTSLQDTSGNVVLEAMSFGLPVVCLDHQGAAEIVSAQCGIKVAIGPPEAVVDGIAKALERLGDPALRKRMGLEARRRIRERYTWDQKGREIPRLYRLAAGKCS